MWDIAYHYRDTSGRLIPIADTISHLPSGCNVLWLDGTVTFVKARDFQDNNLPLRPQGVEMVAPGDFVEESEKNRNLF